MAKKVTLKESDLTHKYIKECFEYREDGVLIWKVRPPHHFLKESSMKTFNTQKSGKVAGVFHKRVDRNKEGFGYWVTNLTMNGELGAFKLHRLIYFYHKGYFPETVDHKDNDTSNNRIENLRGTTEAYNRFNMYKPQHNTSGFKGVSCIKGRGKPYRTEIRCKGESFYLGEFHDAEIAASVYNLAAKFLFGEFCLLNKTRYDDKQGMKSLSKGCRFYKKYKNILHERYDE